MKTMDIFDESTMNNKSIVDYVETVENQFYNRTDNIKITLKPDFDLSSYMSNVKEQTVIVKGSLVYLKISDLGIATFGLYETTDRSSKWWSSNSEFINSTFGSDVTEVTINNYSYAMTREALAKIINYFDVEVRYKFKSLKGGTINE